MSTLRSFVAIAAVCCFVGSSAVADDITGNGGFEVAGMGGAADSDQWNEFFGGAAGTVSERVTSGQASGTAAHRILAIGADGMGAVAGINQNSINDGGFLRLEENTSVTATFDWLGNLGVGADAFGVLRILNGSGAIVADSGLQALGDTNGSYDPRMLSVNVPAFGGGVNNTYAAFLEINVAAGAFNGAISEGFVDNVVINGTPVPEPSSLMVIGAIGAGLLVRRKR